MITEVAAKRSSGVARNANLLIVEDETLSRIELAELLRYYGYKVSHARSGRDAVTKVLKKNREIDAILMDIKMPGELDGIEAARRIQKSHGDIPIIFVTAFADNLNYQQRVRESKLKITGWVDKPIIGENEKKLIELIEREVAKKRGVSK